MLEAEAAGVGRRGAAPRGRSTRSRRTTIRPRSDVAEPLAFGRHQHRHEAHQVVRRQHVHEAEGVADEQRLTEPDGLAAVAASPAARAPASPASDPPIASSKNRK